MRPATYAVEAAVQGSHWWFVGRRRLLRQVLAGLRAESSWRVLDVGTGTGANLAVLHELGVRQVVACDYALDPLERAATLRVTYLARADACSLPFRTGSFDLLVAADVIEHLDDDEAALREFMRVLRPGGHLFLTVPAFPSLWGPQDIVAHHRRRYRREPLLAGLRQVGGRVSACFHFNYLLFVPIWLARKALLAFRVRVESENQINTKLMNRLLTLVFFADVVSAPMLNPPFGVSLCVLAQKPA